MDDHGVRYHADCWIPSALPGRADVWCSGRWDSSLKRWPRACVNTPGPWLTHRGSGKETSDKR